MTDRIEIEPLARHPEALKPLAAAFRAEWPDWYGPDGPGDAAADLRADANEDGLPVGLVALAGGRACGIASLRAESIASHRHLSPWATAGWVDPALRGRGIGSRLVAGLEERARALGFRRVHCATSTAETLLLRLGWRLDERVLHDGVRLGIWSKGLAGTPRPAGGTGRGGGAQLQ